MSAISGSDLLGYIPLYKFHVVIFFLNLIILCTMCCAKTKVVVLGTSAIVVLGTSAIVITLHYSGQQAS